MKLGEYHVVVCAKDPGVPSDVRRRHGGNAFGWGVVVCGLVSRRTATGLFSCRQTAVTEIGGARREGGGRAFEG